MMAIHSHLWVNKNKERKIVLIKKRERDEKV